MPIGKFVEKLIEKQEQGGLSGNAFARELRISPAIWSRIRRGLRPAGRQVRDAALVKWPELAHYLAVDAQEAAKRHGLDQSGNHAA